MASIHSALNASTKLPPASSKEELKPIPQPVKNADNQIKPGQVWIWVFTKNEIALISLQIVALIIAAIFGAWAIRSYDSAKIANDLSKNSLSESRSANKLSEAALDQTSMANQLAILALCQTDPFNSSPACSAVRSAIQLPSLMSAAIPFLTIPQGYTTTVSTTIVSTATVSTTSVFTPDTSTTTFDATSYTIPLPPTFDTTSYTLPTTSDTYTTIYDTSIITSDTTTIFGTPTITSDTTTITSDTPTTGTNSGSTTAVSSTATVSTTTVSNPQTTISTHSTATVTLTPPGSTSTGDTAQPGGGGPSISLGGTIGIIVGVVLFITIIGLLIVGRRRARMRSKEPLAHVEV